MLSITFDEKPTNEAKDSSEIKTTEIKQIQIKPVSNVPQNPPKTVPTKIKSAQIESNIVTRRQKIQDIIKDTESIELTSNTTNSIS